jgi:hypothetical protein
MSDPAIADSLDERRATWQILALVILILIVIYITASDSITYVHVGRVACLVAHNGWHFHGNCSAATPP